jgi:hypothetical protein
LATTAESYGVSTSLGLTPFNYFWASLSSAYHHGFAFNNTTSTVSGTGAGATSAGDTYGVRVFTGTVSGNYAAIKSGATTTFPTSRGIVSGNFNWNKVIAFSGLVQFSQLTANATYRGGMGVATTHANTNLAGKGIAYRLVGTSALELQVHDGTTLVNVTSSYTPTANSPFDLVLYSDGTGNVTLYVDDAVVATSTGGPTGTGANTFNNFFIEADNTGTLGAQSFHYLGNPKTYIGR